ncbi:MAG TPA: hypothetical protein VHH73_10160 [Verrucomicrobiae bacterium]|nr:hypothetical protein [Verrucomicrobiae bacterium]
MNLSGARLLPGGAGVSPASSSVPPELFHFRQFLSPQTFLLMKTRIGKIARLPRPIREQLNERLHEGGQAPELLDWLNGLAEVKALLAKEFDGKPVNPQNLSAWRQGGYEDWVIHGEATELAGRLEEEAGDLSGEGKPKRSLAELMMIWLTARYAVAVRQLGKLDQDHQWKRLRELCADLTRITKLEQGQRRLELEELKAAERASEKVAELKRVYDPVDHLSIAEKLERIRRRLFGDPPPEPACAANPSQSSPIKPSEEPRVANTADQKNPQTPKLAELAPTTREGAQSSPIKANQAWQEGIGDEPAEKRNE